MPCFYLTPKQDDFTQELQVCIAEALYDVDSIVADPGVYTKEQLATLDSQILSNMERAWELSGGSEEQLTGTDGADFADSGTTDEKQIRMSR